MKTWMELIGMAGGPVRPPVLPFDEAEREALKADLERVGLLEKRRVGA